MRGVTSTVLLAVVLIGLVAYIFLVDAKKPVGDAEPKAKAFAAVPADDIEEIEIKSADGERSRLRKTDGQWKIVEPLAAEPDAGEVSSITGSLSDVSIERVVDENPSDLKRFGLEPARIEVGFRAKGKKDFTRLLVGDKTPTGGEAVRAHSRCKARLPVELLPRGDAEQEHLCASGQGRPQVRARQGGDPGADERLHDDCSSPRAARSGRS